jgi:hypothetical protein
VSSQLQVECALEEQGLSTLTLGALLLPHDLINSQQLAQPWKPVLQMFCGSYCFIAAKKAEKLALGYLTLDHQDTNTHMQVKQELS